MSFSHQMPINECFQMFRAAKRRFVKFDGIYLITKKIRIATGSYEG